MITTEFTAQLVKTLGQRCNIPLAVELVWLGETDPLAVQLVIDNEPEGTVVWTLSRDHLLHASSGTSTVVIGSGDVSMRWLGGEKDLIVLCLKSPDGHADLALPRREVRTFLGQTVKVVPPGSESFDEAVDEFLAEVLG